eukprot:TRINITY_DN32236_c0_g1_i1.p2 TRINITY_DN32236_c0_g1~~TRINITY_DN32236_c0_g1_i1.p2  ORF type:complete len:103 (-),score=18.56 TRINITY_DN32236_c0_g1_i1:435-743(-)
MSQQKKRRKKATVIQKQAEKQSKKVARMEEAYKEKELGGVCRKCHRYKKRMQTNVLFFLSKSSKNKKSSATFTQRQKRHQKVSNYLQGQDWMTQRRVGEGIS